MMDVAAKTGCTSSSFVCFSVHLLPNRPDPTSAAMARRLHLPAKDHHLPGDVPNPDEACQPWSSCRDASTSRSAMDSCHPPHHQEHDCVGGEGRTSGCMMEKIASSCLDVQDTLLSFHLCSG
ncbi:uncharacterized protein [Triticum aestivum]|uniref:uncharacterized protein isoform X4 n=1 Tax=Triticum aestivum TaxID=4565 RepID=UPI001D0082F2|nr:uncharacterized protein LOC123092426 isoform X4 [Triticum aestivum]